MVYDGSGPEERERAESFAVLASWASRHGNESAGFDESGVCRGSSSEAPDTADCAVCRALLWKCRGLLVVERGLKVRSSVR